MLGKRAMPTQALGGEDLLPETEGGAAQLGRGGEGKGLQEGASVGWAGRCR
jgi:hypothetical protein